MTIRQQLDLYNLKTKSNIRSIDKSYIRLNRNLTGPSRVKLVWEAVSRRAIIAHGRFVCGRVITAGSSYKAAPRREPDTSLVALLFSQQTTLSRTLSHNTTDISFGFGSHALSVILPTRPPTSRESKDSCKYLFGCVSGWSAHSLIESSFSGGAPLGHLFRVA